MKIAIVGAIDSPIKKDATAGTEIWTYTFAEALIKKGFDVTLFANSDSQFSGHLIKSVDYKDILNNETKQIDRLKFVFFSVSQFVEVIKKQNEFDLIHISVFSFPYILPMTELIKKPVFITIHGSSSSYEDANIFFEKCREPNYIFISDFFRDYWPKVENSRVIHHGIKLEDFPYSDKPRQHYFWMSRISPEKGLDDAIEFAKSTGEELIIAGPIKNQEYFDSKIKPRLNSKIKYIGELDHKRKIEYYQTAKAFLFTIKWREPFGLVVVEAMACGIPVIAYKIGAMPEIISDKIDGFLVDPNSVEGLVKASKHIGEIDNKMCRLKIEEKFNINKMVDKYIEYYQDVLASHSN